MTYAMGQARESVCMQDVTDDFGQLLPVMLSKCNIGFL